jgi:hypothetical protein
MDDEAKLIYKLLDNLIKYSSVPGEIHVCPICNGKLHVWFGGYKRGEKNLFGATVSCESCEIQIAVDYAVSPPSWVKTK